LQTLILTFSLEGEGTRLNGEENGPELLKAARVVRVPLFVPARLSLKGEAASVSGG
jgi:hypothetical protein